jgi:hypothetical protein
VYFCPSRPPIPGDAGHSFRPDAAENQPQPMGRRPALALGPVAESLNSSTLRELLVYHTVLQPLLTVPPYHGNSPNRGEKKCLSARKAPIIHPVRRS